MLFNTIIGGNGGETVTIFVTGLSETDTVTVTKDGRTYNGKWVSKDNAEEFDWYNVENIARELKLDGINVIIESK